MNNDPTRKDMLRVTLHEHDIASLMEQFPKLTRTEISDVVTRNGPLRIAVEAELEKVSRLKR